MTLDLLHDVFRWSDWFVMVWGVLGLPTWFAWVTVLWSIYVQMRGR